MLLQMRMAFLCRLAFAFGNCQKTTTHCVISVCNNGGWGLVIKTDNMSGFLWQGWKWGKNFLTSVNVAVRLPGRSFESSSITLRVLHTWPCGSEIAVCGLSSLFPWRCSTVMLILVILFWGCIGDNAKWRYKGIRMFLKKISRAENFDSSGNSHGGLSLQWL